MFTLVGILMLGACSSKSNNPLLNATDGQFIQAMNFSVGECEAVFFNPSAVEFPETSDKKLCASKVKSSAAFAGIPDAVKLEHIEDPQVKERYFKLKTP